MAYNKNQGNNKNEDFTVVIDDSNFEQNPQNQGSNHDNVSLVILSDLEPTIKTGNDGENEDRIPPAMEDEENNYSVPQQRNVPKTEPKSKSSGTFHWLCSKLGGKPVDAEGPDGHDVPEEPDGHKVLEKQDEPEADENDKKLIEWKILLKTIPTYKTEKQLQNKIDKFLDKFYSNKLKRLE